MPLVDVSNILQRCDDGEFCILNGLTEDAEIVQADVGTHAVGLADHGALRTDDSSDMSTMRAGR